MTTKLILIEGLPGTGKSTTAQYVDSQLRNSGEQTQLFLEGDGAHPADFESMACLDAAEYRTLKSKYPPYADWFDRHAIMMGNDLFFSYRRLQKEFGDTIPERIFNDLADYDVYELPAQKYTHLATQRWNQFAQRSANEHHTYVFECCFLQNPLTMLLGRNGCSHELIKSHILGIAERLRGINTILLYLDSGDVEATLRRVASERPAKWLEFVIWYHTQQGHGKACGWKGMDGLVKFYEMRRAIELDLLRELSIPSLVVKHSGMPNDRQLINQFLNNQLHLGSAEKPQ